MWLFGVRRHRRLLLARDRKGRTLAFLVLRHTSATFSGVRDTSRDAVSIATKPRPAAMEEPSKSTLLSSHAEFGGTYTVMNLSPAPDQTGTLAAGRTLSQPPIFRLSTETLREIFSFLNQSSCSRVARSCKRFKEPALDQLWSKITTLVAPLALLDELVYSNNGWVSAGTLTSLGPIRKLSFSISRAPPPDVP